MLAADGVGRLLWIARRDWWFEAVDNCHGEGRNKEERGPHGGKDLILLAVAVMDVFLRLERPPGLVVSLREDEQNKELVVELVTKERHYDSIATKATENRSHLVTCLS